MEGECSLCGKALGSREGLRPIRTASEGIVHIGCYEKKHPPSKEAC